MIARLHHILPFPSCPYMNHNDHQHQAESEDEILTLGRSTFDHPTSFAQQSTSSYVV